MPLPDLYQATRAIRRLIEVQASLAYNSTPGSVQTSAASPQDPALGTDPVVNVYLFHLIENAHYKNQPPRKGTGSVPIRLSPIGLDLHYVLTTRVPDAGNEDMRVEGEQKLLGIVSKIVHDFPNISDEVLDAMGISIPILGEGNRFDLILRPVGLEEATSFWTADDTHLVRPSLFVEARVVQLEPEEPQVVPGIVLTLGAFVLAGPGPRLTTSRSQLAFVPPDLPVRRVTAEPARVALFEEGEVPWVTAPDEDAQELLVQNNRLVLEGSGLGRGHRFLELRRVGAALVRVDLEPDPADGENVEWRFEVLPNRISMSFLTEVTPADGPPEPLFPGIYTARLVIEEEPRGRVSNQIAFAVIPQITAVALVSGDVYSITVMGAYLQPPPDVEIDFDLVVGDQRFELVPPLDFDASGEFTIFDASTIRFQRATTPGDVFPLPINLTINGAQATPAWLEGP